MSDTLLAITLPAIVVFITALLLYPLARRVGLTDRGDERKQHVGEIPLIGGLAIYAALVTSIIGLGVALPSGHGAYWLGATSLLLLIGLLDDYRQLSAPLRLGFQCLGAAILIFGVGLELRFLGYLPNGAPFSIGFFSYGMTFLALVALINALNMADGIDGLAAGYVLLAASGLLAGAVLFDIAHATPPLVILISALCGYLPLNIGLVPRRKIFLGDAGSTLLGFILGCALIYYGQPLAGAPPIHESHIPPSLVLWCVALPALDMLATSLRRIQAGRSPFLADRTHIHHILLRRGLSVAQSRTLLLTLAAALLGLGFLLYTLGGDALALGGFCLTAIGYFLTMRVMLSAYRAMRRGRAER